MMAVWWGLLSLAGVLAIGFVAAAVVFFVPCLVFLAAVGVRQALLPRALYFTAVLSAALVGGALLLGIGGPVLATLAFVGLCRKNLVVSERQAWLWGLLIVLAGMVRMAEFLLILLVGFAIYAKYVLVAYNFGWNYAAATGAIAALSIIAFQAADIYQIQAFRGYERQYMRLAAAWSLVFLAVMGAAFFLKAGEQF